MQSHMRQGHRCFRLASLQAHCWPTVLTAPHLLLQVFMLPADARCNEETLTAVLKSGHSRLPIHKPGNK